MIQPRSMLDVADNSGAKKVQCIRVMGGANKRYASLGDTVIVAVKEAAPDGIVKKHQRPTQKLRQGGIIEREGAMALSNVLLVCSRCDKASRTGIKLLADGRKVRMCKRCGESVDKG